MEEDMDEIVLGTATRQDLHDRFGYPYLHDPLFDAFVEMLVQDRLKRERLV